MSRKRQNYNEENVIIGLLNGNYFGDFIDYVHDHFDSSKLNLGEMLFILLYSRYLMSLGGKIETEYKSDKFVFNNLCKSLYFDLEDIPTREKLNKIKYELIDMINGLYEDERYYINLPIHEKRYKNAINNFDMMEEIIYTSQTVKIIHNNIESAKEISEIIHDMKDERFAQFFNPHNTNVDEIASTKEEQ